MGWETLYLCSVLLSTIIFRTLATFTNDQYLYIRNDSQSDIDHSSYRLPEGIDPISYDLWIHSRLGVNDFRYQGHVNITLNILKKVSTIVLHNDGLIIHKEKVSLYRHVEKEMVFIRIPIRGHRSDEARQFYILSFEIELDPGSYTLEVPFEGEVRDDVFGFYRSSYIDNGEKKWMGVTQFSPTYARRAFPCMDEPHLKAFFKLHIGHFGNQMTTSNTAIESSEKYSNHTNYYITTFQRTPKMSTYLVGWAVHDFIPETANSSTSFKIWTRRSMALRGSIALNQGLSIYSFLKDWLLVQNPIPKMDQVAVLDFNFNAMENWGMITYRESVVLFENGVTPTKNMFDGFTTMAHEYAHTWFGNLVTPMFWNVAWLKEGFASYFQYFAVSWVEPTWGMMDKFVVDMLQPTLLLDSANHTRVMNGRNVGSPSSIMEAMDFVSYKKGASVIRMLSHVIGDVAFQSGLQSYLKNMTYRAATPFDLYECLQTASDKARQLQRDVLIKDMMESWTTQPGFPLVTITRDYRTETLTVSQEQFYQNRGQFSQNSSRWYIPLNFAKKSSLMDFSRTSPNYWMKPEDKNLTISSIPSEDWVVFNVQQVGYYRVNYDENNWRMLIDYLKSRDFEKIHRVNRAMLIDDAFNLARAGYIDYSIPFNLSYYLIQETDYEPWVAATNSFKFLNKILSSVPDVQKAFQNHVARLLEPMYNRLSFNESLGEDVSTKLHRQIILSSSCSVRNYYCLRTSETLFRKWISASDERILPDVKSFVYCEGIRNGEEKDWYTVLDKLLFHSVLQIEQELFLRALGCTQRSNLISSYLTLSLSGTHSIRKQHRLAILNAILDGDTKNIEHVLQFVRYHLQDITNVGGYDFLGKIINAIGRAVTNEEQTKMLRSFVEDNTEKLGTALNAAKQAVEVSSATVQWIKKYASDIARCFN